MLCFFALTKGAWVGIGIGIFAIIVIVAAVIVNRRDKIKARRKQAGITEEKDVRYSSSAEVSKHDDTPKAAFVQGDLVASEASHSRRARRSENTPCLPPTGAIRST
ncbi:MAG: hypothetical protein ACLTSK_06415 [Christensenellales bacterium]